MPVQTAGPHGSGGAPGTARRTVLLTGASGVVGRALLQRLRDHDVVCLVHRSPVSGPNVTTVPGDIAKPMFGLAKQAHVELTATVDAVVHCAAITDFNRTDGSLEATNVTGTEHAAAFAAAANAVLYHVSTAFVHTTVDGDRGRTAIGYASSKLVAIPCFGAGSSTFASSAPKAPRSSAKWMDSGEVPTIGTPASANRWAKPRGVCPPNCTTTPTTPGPPAALPEESSA